MGFVKLDSQDGSLGNLTKKW